MRILFYLGHPAHYLNVSVVADQLAEKGHDILFVARDKDVLFQLVRDSPYPTVYLSGRKGTGKAALVWAVLKREVSLLKAARRWKPDLMVGTDIVFTHTGKLLGIPTIILNEDDADQVAYFSHLGMRFATNILSPACCDNAPYNGKTVGYAGYHELAYLHPNYFAPDRSKAALLFGDKGAYFILRFSALASHHDSGRTGIRDDVALRIIELLEPHGHVYVTSERALAPQFEPYRIGIDPRDMHHALYYAAMYIGDSQTMTAEAAVLGTPSIRFNDFVGKLSYLEELEHTYKLTFGVKTDDPQRLLARIEEVLHMPEREALWQERRAHMLRSTIDVAAFFTWYFEHVPHSARLASRHLEQLSRRWSAQQHFETAADE